ncbi:phage holin family protein [Paramicrobacterium agarici]|uniref:Putative membrane protein n=1 Tax=Paramicrobacterium agarici TaxID=630514 RepID=A0A2A9DWA7_9MICO|nr:phage holin family protein [Microbacterium agarici]PFG30220.1 putative membrane protein [Microbacterium agarici]TQO23228.1 putative membrane protein [Microbacterium agarici]
MRFLLQVIINGVAIWLTTLIVGGITMTSFGDEWWQVGLSYGVVGLIFAIVNGIVRPIIKVVAFPIYILTLGLISFIVNGLLLLLTAWLSGLFGFGLHVDGFWWGVLGALVIGIINWFIGLFVRPKRGRS